jgi:hypothetical protein
MIADFFFYITVFIVSYVIGIACLSLKETPRTLHSNANRHTCEIIQQNDREDHNPRGLDIDVLAIRVRDTDDPVVEEILEQTCHIRERRRAVSLDRKENEMRRASGAFD